MYDVRFQLTPISSGNDGSSSGEDSIGLSAALFPGECSRARAGSTRSLKCIRAFASAASPSVDRFCILWRGPSRFNACIASINFDRHAFRVATSNAFLPLVVLRVLTGGCGCWPRAVREPDYDRTLLRYSHVGVGVMRSGLGWSRSGAYHMVCPPRFTGRTRTQEAGGGACL